MWIKWDQLKQKYWLRSESLSKFKIVNASRISLTNRLNQRQPFRILPQNIDAIHAFGQFYSINLNLSTPGGTGALVVELMTGLADLTDRISEKGDLTALATHWPDTSVFDLVDRALTPSAAVTPFGPAFPLLVCDDIGQEAADFIAVDKGGGNDPPRIALIAAKGKKRKAAATGVSASDLYDVCGQVVKNLGFLKADTQALLGALTKWDNTWKLEGGEVPRMRAGTTAKSFRTAFAAARAHPAATREIWMVLGGGILSKRAAKTEFGKAVPKAHVLQFHHLLLSTFSACQSVGVNLRIFCVP